VSRIDWSFRECVEVEFKELGDVLDYEQPTSYLVQSTNYDDSTSVPTISRIKSIA